MRLFLLAVCTLLSVANASAQRETVLLNNDWTFHLGDAASMQQDFTHGTEYFTYRAKAIGQNKGPVAVDFNDSTWTHVNLPHDWVVDLPYDGKASHSHGYKQVGWKYPQNSIGWYRKHFTVDKQDEGKAISIRFGGIFRNAQVFCNGFYLGTEPSGYASQEYNVSEYLNYGGDNLITVRCDAMTEEGWYYEGAGIYRDVWLVKKDAGSHIDDVFYTWRDGVLKVKVEATVDYQNILYNQEGAVVATGKETLTVPQPHLWSDKSPYLYTLKTVTADGKDAVYTKVGLRTITFDAKEGVRLNGEPFKFKGADMHLDHPGVGVAVSKELWIYRINKLRALGMNAIRWSHNPASDVMLDVCDSLGVLCIDENRLMGTNQEHYDLLRRMIVDHRNHPSVALWSIGNEEWWIESGDKGEKIARAMIDYARTIDDSRLYTYGNSGGFGIVKQVDVHGYNYIVQNDVDNRHKAYPDWVVVGTEETSACGTRNVYATDSLKGWMESINMAGEERSNGEKNVIERGWKFYRDNIWAGGLFYWTGFDYRGEPNPMVWPATGSQFGILDYCGFPKDEAYYLKAAWTDQPVLHIFPHWNLKGWDGKEIEVWAYSNLDEVELLQDGKSLGRQALSKDGHLVWKTTYRPGKLVAYGYRNGKRVITERVETTGAAVRVEASVSKSTLRHDGQDVVVVDLTLKDQKGRYVPDACDQLQVSVMGDAEILGWGNGDPGYKVAERPQGSDRQIATIPAFMGNAQLLIRGLARSTDSPVTITIRLPQGGNTVVRL
ncbi:MAG: DUF4982 domain-containing protein [Prevotella sp.]|nr:DUF4982 domain-containing protein [Prevotella sp.]